MLVECSLQRSIIVIIQCKSLNICVKLNFYHIRNVSVFLLRPRIWSYLKKKFLFFSSSTSVGVTFKIKILHRKQSVNILCFSISVNISVISKFWWELFDIVFNALKFSHSIVRNYLLFSRTIDNFVERKVNTVSWNYLLFSEAVYYFLKLFTIFWTYLLFSGPIYCQRYKQFLHQIPRNCWLLWVLLLDRWPCVS